MFTVRDEDNRFTTEQRSIPPITVISSTTRINLDKQFERRAWPFSPDESVEQTERIKKWKEKRELEKSNVILGLIGETSEKHSFRVLRAFVNRLQSVNVILPFPGNLMKLLSFDRLRVRGDFDKIIALVKLYGFANQHKLPQLRRGDDIVGVVVTPKIAFEILKIGIKPFATMTVGLERRTLSLLEIFKELEPKQLEDREQQKLDLTKVFEAEQRPARNDLLYIDQEVVAELMKWLKKSRKTIHRYLRQWCDSGWMQQTKQGRKTQSLEFEMLYPVSEIEKKVGLFDISQMAEQMELEFKKEAKEFLKPALTNISREYGNLNIDVVKYFT